MKLGQIAELRSGLILTRKKAAVEYEIKKRYKLISLKNIDDNGDFNQEELEDFQSIDELDKRYFTKAGNILIKLSHPFTVVYIDKSKEGLLVPSYFSIIRLTTRNYIPQYIAWYLNSDRAKKEMLRFQTGSNILTTNNTILSSINIKELPIEEQKAIAKIRKLYLKERDLLNKLIQEKDRYYKGITDKLIN